MRGIGFSFQKGRLRFSVLDTLNSKIGYHDGRPVTVDPDLPLPDLMDRYASQIGNLLDEFAPDVVAARQVWSGKNVDAAVCQIAPVGIAAYISHQRALPFYAFTPQALSQPKPLGLGKGVKPLEAVDETFGKHPPHWDDFQRSSLLVAWRALLEHE